MDVKRERKGRRRSQRSGKAQDVFRARRAPRVWYAIGVLVVCAIPPVFVNDLIGYAPLLFCCSVLVAAYGYVRIVSSSIAHEQRAEYYEWIRGEAGSATAVLANGSRLPAFRIDATFVVADADDLESTYMTVRTVLGGHEQREVGIDELLFDHVGIQQMGLAHLEVFDFLGLFSRNMDFSERCLIRVVPRIYDIEKIAISDTLSADAKRAAKSVISDDVDYAYVREYELGDPMKKVHWKLSARSTQQLYTKLFETHNNPGITVLFDFRTNEADSERMLTMRDTMLEGGFSLLDHARKRGVDTQLVFRDRTGEVKTTARCAPEELDLLIGDMPRPSSEGSEEDAALMLEKAANDPNAQSDFLFFCTEFSQASMDMLIRLKRDKRGVMLVAVVPPHLPEHERAQRLRPLGLLDAGQVPFVWIDEGADVWKAGTR